MQNLQTKYDLHSAQTAYLSQLQLIEEEETTEQRPQRGFGIDFGSFDCFQVQAIENDGHILNYSQYLDEALRINRIVSNPQLRVLLLQVCLLLCGELAQEGYLFRMSQNRDLGLRYAKWIVLGHLFFLFLAFWLFPFFILALVCFLLLYVEADQSGEPFASQFQKLSTLPKQLNLASVRLKVQYLNHSSTGSKQQSQYICDTIGQLLQELEQRFGIILNKDSMYLMDRLDQVIYKIVVKIKEADLEQQFISSGCWFKKIIYCKTKILNCRLQKAICLIEQTILTIGSTNLWSRENKYKQSSDQTLYYSILASKIGSLKALSNPNLYQKVKMRKLTAILMNQLQFRQIRTLREKADLKQQLNTHDEPQLSSFSLVSLPLKAEAKALCFDDDRIEEYKPDDVREIKHRLELVIKDRLKGKQADKPQQQGEEVNKQIISREVRKERVVFGIPIPPPQKDMSAYYIQ